MARILVADDEPKLGTLLAEALELDGHEAIRVGRWTGGAGPPRGGGLRRGGDGPAHARRGRPGGAPGGAGTPRAAGGGAHDRPRHGRERRGRDEGGRGRLRGEAVRGGRAPDAGAAAGVAARGGAQERPAPGAAHARPGGGEPVHAGGAGCGPARRRHRRDGAAAGGERHRQDPARPRTSTTGAAVPRLRWWRSTAQRCRRRCWRASSSATRRAPSPGPPSARPGTSRPPTAARCSWTRSARSTPAMQVKLLRFLQERGYVAGGLDRGPARGRPGDRRHQPRPRARRSRSGTFREDLFYRLNVFAIHLPPLRERREDILPLACRFLAARGLPPEKLPQPARDRLWRMSWPGNVRELENTLERALILAGDAGDPARGPRQARQRSAVDRTCPTCWWRGSIWTPSSASSSWQPWSGRAGTRPPPPGSWGSPGAGSTPGSRRWGGATKAAAPGKGSAHARGTTPSGARDLRARARSARDARLGQAADERAG